MPLLVNDAWRVVLSFLSHHQRGRQHHAPRCAFQQELKNLDMAAGLGHVAPPGVQAVLANQITVRQRALRIAQGDLMVLFSSRLGNALWAALFVCGASFYAILVILAMMGVL